MRQSLAIVYSKCIHSSQIKPCWTLEHARELVRGYLSLRCYLLVLVPPQSLVLESLSFILGFESLACISSNPRLCNLKRISVLTPLAFLPISLSFLQSFSPRSPQSLPSRFFKFDLFDSTIRFDFSRSFHSSIGSDSSCRQACLQQTKPTTSTTFQEASAYPQDPKGRCSSRSSCL